MLQVPLIPHGGSGEEDLILQLLCPLETNVPDQTVSHRQFLQEIRGLCDIDHSVSLIDDDEVSEVDYEVLGDAFFSDIQDMEEKRMNESGILVMINFADDTNKNDEPKRFDRTTNKLQQNVEITKQSESIMNTNSSSLLYKHSKENYHTLPLRREESFLSMSSMDSSIASKSYTTVSCLHYSNESIMKLKARKRMLEKKLSNRFLKSLTLSNEINQSGQSFCNTFVVV